MGVCSYKDDICVKMWCHEVVFVRMAVVLCLQAPTCLLAVLLPDPPLQLP